MKRIFSTVLILAIVSTVFMSCNNNEPDSPIIDNPNIEVNPAINLSRFQAETYTGSDNIKFSYSYGGFYFYYIYLGEFSYIPKFWFASRHHDAGGPSSDLTFTVTNEVRNSIKETVTTNSQTVITTAYQHTVSRKDGVRIGAQAGFRLFGVGVTGSAEHHWENFQRSDEFRQHQHTTSLTNTVEHATERAEITIESITFRFTENVRSGYYRYTMFVASDIYLFVTKNAETGEISYDFKEHVIEGTHTWRLDFSETMLFGRNNSTNFEFDESILDNLPPPMWDLNVPPDPTRQYIDANGVLRTVYSSVNIVDFNAQTTLGTAGQTTWVRVERNRAVSQRINILGDVRLILMDNSSLQAHNGINVTGDNSLTIYAQQAGTGSLTATGTSHNAGIGGDAGQAGGDIIINGGNITATGATASNGGGGSPGNGGGAGIGGGGGNASVGSAGGNITINGGMITAIGGNGERGGNGQVRDFGRGGGGAGAGIGGGGGRGADGRNDGHSGGSSGSIIINGGTVTATGGNRGDRGESGLGRGGAGGGGGRGAGIGGGGGAGGGGNANANSNGVAGGNESASIGNGAAGGRGATNGGAGGVGGIGDATINGTESERNNENGHVRVVVARN